MEQLRTQNEWGDSSDTEYRRLRSEVEAESPNSSSAWKPGTGRLSGGFPRGQRSLIAVAGILVVLLVVLLVSRRPRRTVRPA